MKFLSILLINIIVILIALFFIDILNYLATFIKYNEDIDRNTIQLLESRGFKGEDHYVVTEDGYILLMTRIVNPYVKDRNILKPILLHHGWQCNANIFIINSMAKLDEHGLYAEDNNSGPIGNNLGLVLAVNGYDVWLANMRGNEYSSNHTKLNKQGSEFWAFSIDEMIEYDLPAMISYIQKKTERDQVSYIGHSQGSLEMFALLSTRPHYSQIIKPFIALSPTFFFDHSNQVTPLFKYNQYIYSYLQSSKGPYLSYNYFKISRVLAKICDMNGILLKFCYKIYYNIVGTQEEQCNLSRFPVYLANLASGFSCWNVAHLLQGPRLGSMTKFHYRDPETNMVKYGSVQPPDYDLSAINSTNIAIIYLENDWLNQMQDIQRLIDNLKVPLLDDYLVPKSAWNHMDLLLANNSGKIVNKKILQILSKALG